MTDIYDKHTAAFSQTKAGALVASGMQKGAIAFKYPRDGAGRLSCYLHLFGYPMVCGTAGGFGYDKKSAALESACRKLSTECLLEFPALERIDCEGQSFDSALKKSGFEYYSVI